MRRPLWKRVLYAMIQAVLLLLGTIFFGVRLKGKQFEPSEGPVLVVSNHQSHLDPPFIGMFCRRRLNYLARETLFHFLPLGWLLPSLDAIPIDREGLGLAGVKETLRRLKRGEMVLIFPEGSRTSDGRVGELKRGFCSLARRGGVQVMPVAIAGAYEVWPRGRHFPRPGVVHLQFGRPFTPGEIRDLSDEQLVAEIRRRIIDCHAAATRSVRLTRGLHQTADSGIPLPAHGE